MPVAVLIVNYRAYDDLERTLASLERHLTPDDEVAVVDWESDARRLDPILARYPRVVGIRRADNRGFAAGVNLAASATRAPYLFLLNPDTRLDEPVPRVLEDWLRDHPTVGVVGPRVVDQDGSVQASARRFPGLSTMLGGRSSWLTRRFPNNWFARRNLLGRAASGSLDVDWVAGSCLMTPRAVFDRAGRFDEQFFLFWEDADYCRRVTGLGLRCTYLPLTSVTHVGGQSTAHNRDDAIRAFHSSALRLYRKHAGWGRRLAVPAVALVLRLRQAMRLRRHRRS